MVWGGVSLVEPLAPGVAAAIAPTVAWSTAGKFGTDRHQVGSQWTEDGTGGFDRNVPPLRAKTANQIYNLQRQHRFAAGQHHVGTT